MVKNTYRVPKKRWQTWDEAARYVFNETYSTMHDNVELFLHPKQEEPGHIEWKTTAWNAAWIAADAVLAHNTESK